MKFKDVDVPESIAAEWPPKVAAAMALICGDQGFPASADGVTQMLERAVADSVVPGICTRCKGVQECEPDATANYCEECESPTVKSVLVIACLI